MSRVGVKPVEIPAGVEVELQGRTLRVRGPRAELTQELHPDVTVDVGDDVITVTRPSDEHEHRALHGLHRALIQNMVTGVSEGFQRRLEIVGIGYRAQGRGPDGVTIQAGYSHPVDVDAPEGVTFEVPDPSRVTVSGTDKQQVGQVAANIRSIRPPEPYKGKGIRYEGEEVGRKAGKAGG